MQKHKIVPSEEGISMEDALLEFNNLYIPKAEIISRYGDLDEQTKSALKAKNLGSIDNRLNKVASTLGVTLDQEKTTERLEAIVSAYESKIADLNAKNEELVKNPESKKEIENLTQKIADLTALNDKLKVDYEKTIEEKTTIEKEFTTKEKQLYISTQLNSVKSQFVLIEDQNTRDACELDFMKLKFEIDENKAQVVYGEDGKIILSKTKAGAYADYKEVVESIYTKRNAFKKVVGGGVHTPVVSDDKKALTGRVDLASKVTLGRK